MAIPDRGLRPNPVRNLAWTLIVSLYFPYCILVDRYIPGPTVEDALTELNRTATEDGLGIEVISVPGTEEEKAYAKEQAPELFRRYEAELEYHPIGFAVVRYPLEATAADRQSHIDSLFPDIFLRKYRISRYVIVHPDRLGRPTVSDGRHKRLGLMQRDLSDHPLERCIIACGYTPGEVMHDYTPIR